MGDILFICCNLRYFKFLLTNMSVVVWCNLKNFYGYYVGYLTLNSSK